MPKSSKQIKNSSPKAGFNKYLFKTVKAYSRKLPDPSYEEISNFFIRYGQCRHYFLNRFCSIAYMCKIDNFRSLRNEVRRWDKPHVKGKRFKDGILESRYHFQTKHWVNALSETCGNLKSMWSNLANRLRKLIQANDNLSADQRHLLNFILMSKTAWQEVLLYRDVKSTKKYKFQFDLIANKLNQAEYKHALNYLRRITYHYHYRQTRSHKLGSSIKLDLNWNFKDQYFYFSSDKSRKQFCVPVTSNWCYKNKGTITIVLDRIKKRLEVHKLIMTKKRVVVHKHAIGIDKGLATLISASSGHEYGQNFGKFENQGVNRFAKKQAQRNPYLSKHYLLRQKLKRYDRPTNELTKSALRKKHQLLNKLMHLEKHNIGSKRYFKRKQRYNEAIYSKLNHAINQLIDKEKPNLVVKEDLTFTKEKAQDDNRFSRRMRRQLNSWIKGRLDDRLNYKCEQYGIKVQDINPAYTSQYCPNCGYHYDGKRFGKHCELVKCRNCGVMNCNIAAAQNILARYSDQEITLYTPYKEVKKILDKRIQTA